MTVVIQYANAYSNLKNQDFWCGHLRTDQDCRMCLNGPFTNIVVVAKLSLAPTSALLSRLS